MKTEIQKTTLRFFEDENGIYGVTHKDTFDGNSANFDAFWGGTQIFHDIFEHAHEHTNEYFRGDNAMNLGGEMTAMGAMYYYLNTLGVDNRRPENNYRYISTDELTIGGTMSDVQDNIDNGSCRFGYELMCGVPRQKDTNHYGFESMLTEYIAQVKGCKIDRRNDDQQMEDAKRFKKSVTASKIKNLHRYGYRMAENLIPDNEENRDTLNDFITSFDTFCEKNVANEMYNNFRYMEFTLYKDENDIISWECELIPQDGNGLRACTLTPENIGYFSMEDCFELEEEEIEN